jgi:cytochrome P450
MKAKEENRPAVGVLVRYAEGSPSVRQLLGASSLALQTGHQHVSRRKILAQAFQPRALAGYVEAMNINPRVSQVQAVRDSASRDL